MDLFLFSRPLIFYLYINRYEKAEALYTLRFFGIATLQITSEAFGHR